MTRIDPNTINAIVRRLREAPKRPRWIKHDTLLDSPGGGGLVPVNVEQTGGVNGTKTAAATYTYAVTDVITDEVLLTDASPAWARPKGAVHVATHGTAYHGPSGGGGWVLYQVDEQPMVGC